MVWNRNPAPVSATRRGEGAKRKWVSYREWLKGSRELRKPAFSTTHRASIAISPATAIRAARRAGKHTAIVARPTIQLVMVMAIVPPDARAHQRSGTARRAPTTATRSMAMTEMEPSG
jgi:hypothetical protein